MSEKNDRGNKCYRLLFAGNLLSTTDSVKQNCIQTNLSFLVKFLIVAAMPDTDLGLRVPQMLWCHADVADKETDLYAVYIWRRILTLKKFYVFLCFKHSCVSLTADLIHCSQKSKLIIQNTSVSAQCCCMPVMQPQCTVISHNAHNVRCQNLEKYLINSTSSTSSRIKPSMNKSKTLSSA